MPELKKMISGHMRSDAGKAQPPENQKPHTGKSGTAKEQVICSFLRTATLTQTLSSIPRIRRRTKLSFVGSQLRSSLQTNKETFKSACLCQTLSNKPLSG
ncbi:hypothetical protein MTR_2g023240 [Medicago truncatula]|uniref:Uncharacterized protein n=1 Tax=Medicago truncatula TaxID=3880 RepID=A0A072V4Z4_MEDTR|nr:hypothetical protein MTR_2g023240 [Medicago truncatula]